MRLIVALSFALAALVLLPEGLRTTHAAAGVSIDITTTRDALKCDGDSTHVTFHITSNGSPLMGAVLKMSGLRGTPPIFEGVTDKHGVFRTRLAPPIGTTSVYNVRWVLWVDGAPMGPGGVVKISCPFATNDPTAANVSVTIMRDGKPLQHSVVSISAYVNSFMSYLYAVPAHSVRTDRYGVASWQGLPSSWERWRICDASFLHCAVVTLVSGNNYVSIEL